MRTIDLLHLGRERVVGAWEHDGVLIDPGPQSCEDALVEGLGGVRPRAILLTHIHFDHAGACGALLERWPEVDVYVHERGLRHLADPERLVASATQVFGAERFRALWGEVVPVPAERLRPLSGGERILEDFEVTYTPGHASHHVVYRHAPSRVVFAGDVAGVRIPPADYVVAPTPPPDVDVDAWEDSLDRLLALRPAALALAHFGRVDDVEPHVRAVRERLHEIVLLSARHGEEAFLAGTLQRLEEHTGDLAETYRQASPPEHAYPGLERWRRKRAEAAAGA